MGSRSPETQIKRARELALKERRERKQAKKDARAAERRRELEEPTIVNEDGDELGEQAEPDEQSEAVSLEA